LSSAGQAPIVPNLLIPLSLLENATDNTIDMNLTGMVFTWNPQTDQEDSFYYTASTEWSLDDNSTVLEYNTLNGFMNMNDWALSFEELIAYDTSSGSTKDELMTAFGNATGSKTSYIYNLDCPSGWTDGGTMTSDGCSDVVQVYSITCTGGRRSPNGTFYVQLTLCEQSLYDYMLSYSEKTAYYWNATLRASF